MMITRAGAFAAASLVGASVANAQAFFDDFNRANAGDLGANWTAVANTVGISGNQAYSPGGPLQSQAVVNGLTNPLGGYSMTLDVSAGAGLSYGAITMAYAGIGSNQSIFFKLQGSGGVFTNYGFYTGNNLNSGGSYTAGGGFFALAFGYGTARMTMSVAGSVVTVDIDGSINGSIDHTLQATMSAGMMSSLGTGAGVGVYGDGRLDNFNAVVPEPGTFFAIGIGLAGLALARRRK